MKSKLLPVFLLFLLAMSSRASARKQDSSLFADSLLQLVQTANGDTTFGGIITGGAAGSDRDGTVYTATPALGADAATAHPYIGRYKRLDLSFTAANPRVKEAAAAVEGLFGSLTETKQALQYGMEYMYTGLMRKGRTILSYRFLDGSLVIRIYPTPGVLADEAAYGGKFPAAPTASVAPQITEHPYAGCSGATVHENGLFAEGRLVSGARTIRGGNSFYDGYWFCEQWVKARSPYTSTVYVLPDSSPSDTISGQINDGNLRVFYPDRKYATSQDRPYKSGVFQIKKHMAAWLQTSYYEQVARVERERSSFTYEEATRREDRMEKNQAEEERTRCQYCGGTGSVHTGTYLMGREYMTTCSYCHGTGKIQ